MKACLLLLLVLALAACTGVNTLSRPPKRPPVTTSRAAPSAVSISRDEVLSHLDAQAASPGKYKRRSAAAAKPVAVQADALRVTAAPAVAGRQLPSGIIAFPVPKEMTEMKAETFTLRVAVSQADVSAGTLPEFGKGDVAVESVGVADTVKAQLAANPDDFKIVAMSPDVLGVPDRGYAQWEWSVTPERYGNNLQLHLFVSALVKGVAYGTPKDYAFHVRADRAGEIRRFVASEYKWLWVTVPPVVVAIWAFIKRRGKDGRP